jgi:hypothetical protein
MNAARIGSSSFYPRCISSHWGGMLRLAYVFWGGSKEMDPTSPTNIILLTVVAKRSIRISFSAEVYCIDQVH